ncbi:hypothetical protein Scep_028343 [Stephania cephalantha]|uniref:Uncharacterized protein n=1 Tax=Stephania cephalantha TaxID=152367 RepID=A0AAP0E9T7_9MAGN
MAELRTLLTAMARSDGARRRFAATRSANGRCVRERRGDRRVGELADEWQRLGALTAATVSGSTSEGLLGVQHGGAYQQRGARCNSGPAQREGAHQRRRGSGNARENGVEQRHGGALSGRSIPDETTTVDNGGVTSTKLDDAMDFLSLKFCWLSGPLASESWLLFICDMSSYLDAVDISQLSVR